MLEEKQIVVHTNGDASKSSKIHKKRSTHVSKKKDNSSVTKRKSGGSLKPGHVKKDVGGNSIQKNEASGSAQGVKVNVCVKRKSKAAITLTNIKPKKKNVTPNKAAKRNDVKRSICKETPQQALCVPPEIDNTTLQFNQDDVCKEETVYDIPDDENKNGINSKEHLLEEDQLEDFDVLSQYSCMTDIDTSQDVDVSGCPLSDWKEEALSECFDDDINVTKTKTFDNQNEKKMIDGLHPLQDSCCSDSLKVISQIDLTDNDRKTLHYVNKVFLHQDVDCVSENVPLESQTKNKNTLNSKTHSISPKVQEAEHLKIPKRIRLSNAVTDIIPDPQLNEENTNKNTSMASKGLALHIDKNFRVNTLQENKKRKVTREILLRGVSKKQKQLDSAVSPLQCSDAMESSCDPGLIKKNALLTLKTQPSALKNEVFNQSMKECKDGPTYTPDDVTYVSMPVCGREGDTAASNVVSRNIEESTTLDTSLCQGERQEENVNTVMGPTTQNMDGNINPCFELSCDSKLYQSRVMNSDKIPGLLLDSEATTKTKLGVSKQKKRSKHSRKIKDSEEVLVLPDGTHDGLSLRIQLPNRCDVEKNNLTKKLTWGDLKNSWPSIIQWNRTIRDKRLDTEMETILPEASTVTCNVSLSVKPELEESVLFEDSYRRNFAVENKTFDDILVSVLEDLKTRFLLNSAVTDNTFISTTPCQELTISVQCDLSSLPSFLQTTHSQPASMLLQRLHESISTMGYQKQEYQCNQNDCPTGSNLPLLWSQSSTHSTHLVYPYSVVYSKTVFLLSPSALSEDCFKDRLFLLTFQFCSHQKTECHGLNFDTSILTSLRDEWEKNQLPNFFSIFFDSHSKPVFWIPKNGKTLLKFSSLPSPPYVNMASTELVRVMKETVSFVIRNSTTQMGSVSFPVLAIHIARIVSNENSQIPNLLKFIGFNPQKVWLLVKRPEETNQHHTSTKISLLQKLRLDSEKSATVSA